MDVGLKINVLENRATILNFKHIYMPEKVEGNFFKNTSWQRLFLALFTLIDLF